MGVRTFNVSKTSISPPDVLCHRVKRKRRHRIHGKCGTALERKKVKVITITITWNKNMTIEQYRPSEHIKRQSSHIENSIKENVNKNLSNTLTC